MGGVITRYKKSTKKQVYPSYVVSYTIGVQHNDCIYTQSVCYPKKTVYSNNVKPPYKFFSAILTHDDKCWTTCVDNFFEIQSIHDLYDTTNVDTNGTINNTNQLLYNYEKVIYLLQTNIDKRNYNIVPNGQKMNIVFCINKKHSIILTCDLQE